jgi:hypothetical protein
LFATSTLLEEHPMDNHYDVIVAGGRCAGAATAMLLARADAWRGAAPAPLGSARGGRRSGHPAVRAGQFSYGDDVETVEVAAVGFRHAWEAAARVPVSDGHSCRERCDAAMVYDSGTDADDHW